MPSSRAGTGLRRVRAKIAGMAEYESAKEAKFEKAHGGEKGESPKMKALEAVRSAHRSKPKGKPMKPHKGMGFANAAASIAARPGFTGNPGAILAAAARGASAGAKRANPNLKNVKG